MRKPDYDRRVVVTGLGVVSPVGNDKQTAWDHLVRGVSGLGEITRFDVSRYEQKAAGEVKDFDPKQWMDAKAARRGESSMHFGVAAAKQAIADSGFAAAHGDERADRCGHEGCRRADRWRQRVDQPIDWMRTRVYHWRWPRRRL